jgi:hypothetical protein
MTRNRRIPECKNNKNKNKCPLSMQLVSMTRWKQRFIEIWKKTNPNGLLLDDRIKESHWMECWELDNTFAIILQPTFETKKSTNKVIYEIITWIFIKDVNGEEADVIEDILDHLPYDSFEAPRNMPHVKEFWTYGGMTSWSCIGLDPGSVPKPILPLIVS